MGEPGMTERGSGGINGVVAFFARVASLTVAGTVPLGVRLGAISELARSYAFGTNRNFSRHPFDSRMVRTRQVLCLISPKRSPIH